MIQKIITVDAQGRGTYNITDQIAREVENAGLELGLVHLFVQHTSASLMLCENADPDVRQDLETFMAALAKDGDPRFLHQSEGPDDMPAHIRSVLTGMDVTIPVSMKFPSMGRLALGTWQGVYLWEHRQQSHRRNIVLTMTGDFVVD